MRMLNALKNDIRFQYKYGFYLLYLVITAVYIGVILALPSSWRKVVAAVVVFSDPAALGFVFMGAIVLFEKSERVLNSLFISPLKVNEYILSKVLSLSLISTLVGSAIVILTCKGSVSVISVILGVLLGSILFSLAGLIVATRINSLNQFIIGLIPIGSVLSMPPFLVFFGYHNILLDIHPGSIILKLILTGVTGGKINLVYVFILMMWTAIFWIITNINVKKMVSSLGT
jgi:fluoroquinolone transport system permease protein